MHKSGRINLEEMHKYGRINLEEMHRIEYNNFEEMQKERQYGDWRGKYVFLA